MLAYYTANAFATGFKKSLAFQLRGIKQNRGSSGEGIWITKRQPGSSCTSPDVMAFMGSKDMLCRVAILNIGLGDTLAQFTIEQSATAFKKSAGLRAARHQAEQTLFRRGHLDHQAATWQLMHFNRRGGLEDMLAQFAVVAGIKKMPSLSRAASSRAEARQEDTLAYFTMQESAAGFKRMLAPQLRGIKQSRGSTS
ncbi:unnamed protein product, partial [Symbiodinium necroappetens]